MKEQIITNNFRTFFYLMSLILLFIGCKKDSGSSASEGNGSLVFKIEGILPVHEEYGKQASIDSKNSYVKQSKDYQNVGKVDWGIETVVGNMSSSFGEGYLKDNNSKILNKSAAATADMGSGIKYVILLYNKTTKRTEFIGQATVGQSLIINAVKGEQYDWVAYSYNNTNDITTLPTSINDVIDTPTDSELLYASGTASTTVFDKPIPIVFQHKLAEVVFEVDISRLFGKINSDVVLSFESGNNPLTQGKFSLKSGETSDIVSYTKTLVLEQDPANENIKIARFYVADITKDASFNINISNLQATYLNNVKDILIEPTAFRSVLFNWDNKISLGKRYTGKLKMWYKFPTRTILHVTRIGAEGYGYAAQPYSANGIALSPEYNKASYNLLAEPKNFGSLTESVVRSGGFNSIRCFVNGTLNTFLANKPDIVIISVYYQMDEDDRTALITYLNSGGVLLLMTDGINNSDRVAQEPFFRDLFNNQSITLQNNGYSSGALYKLANIDDEILNGPFGDVRGKYWGEDASATTSLANVPSSEITEYSEAKAANGTIAANGITMFKHKSRHFFWIGDGGFLSNEYARGIYTSYTIEPFATVSTTYPPVVSLNPNTDYNYDNFPIPKKYGYEGNGILMGDTDVYNSTVFANIMSWAVINAEFFGINTGGLGRLLPTPRDWEVNIDSLNVNF